MALLHYDLSFLHYCLCPQLFGFPMLSFAPSCLSCFFCPLLVWLVIFFYKFPIQAVLF
jgi:hypothetical protein